MPSQQIQAFNFNFLSSLIGIFRVPIRQTSAEKSLKSWENTVSPVFVPASIVGKTRLQIYLIDSAAARA